MIRKRRILCFFFAVCLFIGLVPVQSLAAEENSDEKKETVQALILPGSELVYAYDDAWFEASSDVYNPHLATVSMLRAQKSNEKDASLTMLEDMGFEDVRANGYYDIPESRPNGVALTIGRKEITAGDETVTLITMGVRGFDYELEWDGNATVGKNGLHEGFKAACDEALRFLKNYVQENAVAGRVKFWICGHSRGGAIANLVAADLAASEGEYIPGMNPAPEDIYAYCFAVPSTVIQGTVTKEELLSVGGAGQGEAYAKDTPGSPYTYAGADGGTVVDPQAEIFNGIHVLRSGIDLITLLPLQGWGYSCFGVFEPDTFLQDPYGVEYYLSYLFGEQAGEDFAAYGGPENFKWMTLDISSLSLVEDTAAPEPASQSAFFRNRVDQVLKAVGSSEAYAEEGDQEVIAALAGLVGTLRLDLLNALKADQMSAIKTGILIYIGYVKQWYKEHKNTEISEGEAAEIIFAWVTGAVTGQNIDPQQFTVDDLLYCLCKYVVDHSERQYDPEEPTKVIGFTFQTKLAETILNTLTRYLMETGKLSEDMFVSTQNLIYQLFYDGAYKNVESPEQATGKDDGDRSPIYMMISFGIQSTYPEIAAALGYDGACRVSVLLDAALPIVREVTAEDGSSVTYATAEEAADAMIAKMVTNAMDALTASGRVPSSGYVGDLYRAYAQVIASHPDKLRKDLTCFLLGTDGDDFDVEAQIRNVATLIGNANAVVQTHTPQTFTAWILAQDDMYPVLQTGTEEGEYEKAVDVTLTASENADIYYTLDGTDPTVGSEKYTGSISLPQTGERQEITVKAIGVRNGKAGRVWEFTYVIEAPVQYQVTEGDGAVWTKGSEETLSFTAKRSCHDEKTIDSFTGLLIDGDKVDESLYSKKAGSVIISLGPEYLETLAKGSHSLTMEFSDAGPAKASFTIEEEKKENPGEKKDDPGKKNDAGGDQKNVTPKPGSNTGNRTVKTGDDTPVALFRILMISSLIAIGAVLICMKRKKTEKKAE